MFYYEPYIIVIIIVAILLILEYPLLKTFLIDEDSSKLKSKRAIPKKKTVKRAPKQKTTKQKIPKQKTTKQKKIKKSKIKQAPTPTTSAATIIANQEDIRKLELQIKSINTMIQNIDIKFRNGEISQAKYYEKKSFLAEKLGGLNGQLEQFKG